MKKVKFLGQKLSREQLRNLHGGDLLTDELSDGEMCVVKSCKEQSDCNQNVLRCHCYLNVPNDGWGYCQKRS